MKRMLRRLEPWLAGGCIGILCSYAYLFSDLSPGAGADPRPSTPGACLLLFAAATHSRAAATHAAGPMHAALVHAAAPLLPANPQLGLAWIQCRCAGGQGQGCVPSAGATLRLHHAAGGRALLLHRRGPPLQRQVRPLVLMLLAGHMPPCMRTDMLGGRRDASPPAGSARGRDKGPHARLIWQCQRVSVGAGGCATIVTNMRGKRKVQLGPAFSASHDGCALADVRSWRHVNATCQCPLLQHSLPLPNFQPLEPAAACPVAGSVQPACACLLAMLAEQMRCASSPSEVKTSSAWSAPARTSRRQLTQASSLPPPTGANSFMKDCAVRAPGPHSPQATVA